MSLDFEKYAAKGNEMVNMLAGDLQVPRDKAGRILRAVLHAIRNRLSIDESLQVIAQLPMALKAIYVDQWNPSKFIERIHHLSEFLDEVRQCDIGSAGYDFGNDASAKLAVKGVFRTLSYYLSAGEFEDMIAIFPTEMKEFVQSSIGIGRMAL